MRKNSLQIFGNVGKEVLVFHMHLDEQFEGNFYEI